MRFDSQPLDLKQFPNGSPNWAPRPEGTAEKLCVGSSVPPRGVRRLQPHYCNIWTECRPRFEDPLSSRPPLSRFTLADTVKQEQYPDHATSIANRVSGNDLSLPEPGSHGGTGQTGVDGAVAKGNHPDHAADRDRPHEVEPKECRPQAARLEKIK